MAATLDIRRERPSTPPASAPVLRWTFLYRSRALTCQIDARNRNAYDVAIVPHWDVSSAVVETFSRPSDALCRHAEIAAKLREAGWLLAREP
jgi:hypothetical protein